MTETEATDDAPTEWTGDYEKHPYLVHADGTEPVVCWPNAGRMHAMDGTGRAWVPEDRVRVVPLSIDEARKRLGHV